MPNRVDPYHYKDLPIIEQAKAMMLMPGHDQFGSTSTRDLILANIGLTMLLLRKVEYMSGQIQNLDAGLDELEADVANETTVEQSAITLMNGIPQMIADAVAAAQAAGATPAQLARLTALRDGIVARVPALAAAVTANTPAGPTP